jgi:hypothetical protein
MLPVNAKSMLSAKDFVDAVSKTTCLAGWMKAIFSVKGQDLVIAKTYKFPKSPKPPDWFGIWFAAALGAWEADEWELTTGSLEMKGKGLSIMFPDGISIGKSAPDGSWVDVPQFATNDTGVGGVTVPTQSIRNDLNASSDADLHYNGAIVKTAARGKTRGAIVIASRLKAEDGTVFPMNANEITGTLFHELFHAGRISRGGPHSHGDKRFDSVITMVVAPFTHC